MHYVPSCAHPEEEQKVEEVFIWTSADYDPGTDLLAVIGYIWACPYSTIVLDFSCPFQPPRSVDWLDWLCYLPNKLLFVVLPIV